MVEVSMGEEDGLEVFFLTGIEAGHEAAGVDGDSVVDQEAGVLRCGGLQVVGAEDADFHFLLFCPWGESGPLMIADWEGVERMGFRGFSRIRFGFLRLGSDSLAKSNPCLK